MLTWYNKFIQQNMYKLHYNITNKYDSVRTFCINIMCSRYNYIYLICLQYCILENFLLGRLSCPYRQRHGRNIIGLKAWYWKRRQKTDGSFEKAGRRFEERCQSVFYRERRDKESSSDTWNDINSFTDRCKLLLYTHYIKN